VVGAPAAPADAHAFLQRSTPADGVVLDSAPEHLQLEFSEAVVLAATRIDVVDSDGHHYAARQLHVIAQQDAAGWTGLAVAASLPSLPRNAYRVSWETLSGDDLHRTSGLFVFGVGQPVSAAGLSEPAPRPDEAALRWLVFVALSLALGGGLAGRLFRRQGGAAAACSARRCLRWSAGGALAGALLAGALAVDQLVIAGAAPLLGPYAAHWLLREAGFVLLLVAARSPRRSLLFGTGAAAACTGAALLGHAAAGAGSAATRVAADAVHLAGAGTWAGAVLVLGLVGVPLLRAGGAGAASARAALRAFSWPAAACVGVMVVTGLYLASGLVGSVDAVLLTDYGRTLLLKLILAGVAAGLGLLHTVRLRRAGRRPGARPVEGRTILAEAASALCVLLLAAVLTSAQPALEPQLVRAPPVPTVPVVDGQAADLQETLAIRPNRPVGVFDTRRPAPGRVEAVEISFVRSGAGPARPAAAERLSDGRWSVAVQLPSAGPTRVVVTAHRAGLPDATRSYDWTVGDAPTAIRPPTVSNAPIGGVLKAASAALALVAVVLLVAAIAWSRRRRAVAFDGRFTARPDALVQTPSATASRGHRDAYGRSEAPPGQPGIDPPAGPARQPRPDVRDGGTGGRARGGGRHQPAQR
jgi:copper transport protein